MSLAGGLFESVNGVRAVESRRGFDPTYVNANGEREPAGLRADLESPLHLECIVIRKRGLRFNNAARFVY